MVAPIVVGIDVGNAMIKVFEGARRRWLAPNALDYRTDQRLVEGHGESPDTWLDIEFLDSPATLPMRVYVGDLAVRRGAAARPVVTSKLQDEQTAIALVAGLARTVAHRLKNMSKVERDAYLTPTGNGYTVPVLVGTGCPIHEFNAEGAAANKRLFASRVKGQHRVRFGATPEYQALGEIVIDVRRLLLYQEGVSAIADYQYTDEGTLRRRGELGTYAACIDLGANTCDWAVQRPDGAVDPLLTGGRDFGLAEAMDALTAAINAKYGRRYTRAQLVADLVALNYAIPEGRATISVWDMAQHYLARVADEVLALARKLQYDSQHRIGLILFAGGGAATLRRFLEGALREGFRGVEIEWANEPLFSNSGGYFKRVIYQLIAEADKVAAGGQG